MNRIQKDIQRYTTDANGFAVSVLFSITNGVTVLSVTCNAIAVKHHLSLNEFGQPVANAKVARVSVSELALEALGFPVRDTNNKVNLTATRVTWKDVSGVEATYSITQQYPNEVTGLIVCLLGDFGAVTPPGRTIIGWIVSPFSVFIVNTVDPTQKQTLANGDIINKQYALNTDGTLTIPYMVGYTPLEPFVMDNSDYQNMPFDKSTGTFNSSSVGGFSGVTLITFNASIPVWQS